MFQDNINDYFVDRIDSGYINLDVEIDAGTNPLKPELNTMKKLDKAGNMVSMKIIDDDRDGATYNYYKLGSNYLVFNTLAKEDTINAPLNFLY